MSTRYKYGDRVPTIELSTRLYELSKLVANEDRESLLSELTMRIPAELDRDADCVLSESAQRLVLLETTLENVVKALEAQTDSHEDAVKTGRYALTCSHFIPRLEVENDGE